MRLTLWSEDISLKVENEVGCRNTLIMSKAINISWNWIYLQGVTSEIFGTKEKLLIVGYGGGWLLYHHTHTHTQSKGKKKKKASVGKTLLEEPWQTDIAPGPARSWRGWNLVTSPRSTVSANTRSQVLMRPTSFWRSPRERGPRAGGRAFWE